MNRFTPLLHIFLSYIALILGQEVGFLPSVEAFSIHVASSTTNKPLKWLIVGGGPHGVHIATRLLEEVPSISHSDLRIVDDEPTLLHKWKTRTAATGMAYLRSSATYHLDAREDSLKRYAEQTTGGETTSSRSRRSKNKRQPTFAADYHRPKLDFFNEHCDFVVEKNNLTQAHVQGMVTDVVPKENSVEVEIKQPNGDSINACTENVVLALGNDAPVYPNWANEEMIRAGKIKHMFDNEGDDDSLCSNRHHQSIAIVGGGISAAHLALKLEGEATSTTTTAIHMICRHELREQQFDTHQDWMMDSLAAKRSEAGGGQGIPKRQRHFASLDSYTERRNVIQRERNAGTISASVGRGKDGLRYAIKGERIHWHNEVIQSVTEEKGSGELSLSMSSGDNITVDQVILATGFGKRPPASFLINRIAQRHDLKLCACGYPAPDELLRWHERIYLAGALAELELGPSARNLAGARLASERIVTAASSQVGN